MFPMLQHSRALLVTLRERADDDSVDGNHLYLVSHPRSSLQVVALDWISEIQTFLQNTYQVNSQELSSVLNLAQEKQPTHECLPQVKMWPRMPIITRVRGICICRPLS